jgi:hypothetical protein
MITLSQRSTIVEAFPRIVHGMRFALQVEMERVDAIAESVTLDSYLFESQSIKPGRHVQLVQSNNQTHDQ